MELRDELFTLWEEHGSCVESVSSEGWALADALMPLVKRAQAEAEKAVLVKVAETAEELLHAREEVRERIYDGYSVDWSDGYDAACGDIAKWARREIEKSSEGNET